MSSENKALILVPHSHRLGGIRNYYQAIKKFSDRFEYINRGEAKKDEYFLLKFFRLIRNYITYLKKIYIQSNIKVIIYNTSLGRKGILRDGVYILLTRLTPINKEIVFFRGWNPSFEKKIEDSIVKKMWLRKTFLNADHIIVLSTDFKKKLYEWGYVGPISVETTIVDEKLIGGLHFKHLLNHRKEIDTINLLYVGSIHKEKGVRELIESIEILKKRRKFNSFQLNMAGVGSDFVLLRDKAIVKNLPVNLLGCVKGVKKSDTFKNAHIFVFASYHEGMPNSVLEAMAFGLPVITTRVGGIPDFFEDGKMGLFLDSRNPEHIAERIQYLLARPDLMEKMSRYNYEYAKEHFYASKVAKRLERIIDEVISNGDKY